MKTICIDAWNQTGINETTFTVRSAGRGGERNDATLKVAILNKAISFEPGILKREGKESRLNTEVGSTLRSQMGDNQTAVISFSAKPGEMIRLSDNPHLTKEVSQTLTRSDGKLGDNQPTVVAFAQNTRENASQDQSAILKPITPQQNNTNNMKAEVRRLTPTEVQRLQGFNNGHLDVNDQGDSAKYSETGNSWAVNNARFVIKGIHKVDAKLNGGKVRPFKYGTISSGVEAHTQAVEGFGDKAVFFSEIAPSPCSVLNAHYPEVPNLGDMTLVDFDAEKNCIHNRPYDGYEPVGKDVLGFEPFKTEEPVEIPCSYGDVDLISGGTPCFTKDSMVLTESGYKPINEVRVGEKVVTHLGNLKHVVRVGHKKSDNIFRIKIKGRPSFRVTGNHPFWTGTFTREWNNSVRRWYPMKLVESKWTRVADMTDETYAALFNFNSSSGNVTPLLPKVYEATDIQIAELIGWYIGDGYIRRWKGKSKKAVILCLNEKKVETFESHFKGVINYTLCKGRTAIKVQICCTDLANFLSEMFGELSFNKHLPASVYFWNKELKDAIVLGYFNTDGCTISCGTPGKRFTTVSPALAYGIADLIGKSGVSVFRRPPTYVIEGRTVNQRDSWTIATHDSTRTFHSFDKWDFVKVSEIEMSDVATVYNLEVEGDHSYICNGYCVHNCQDLSVAGKRKGAVEGSNTRSSLAYQLPRIGAALGSRWILWENVAGAFSSNGGKDLSWLLHRMTEYGYTSLAWRCMDAQYIRTDKHPRAVPQRRRRVWIVGYKGSDWRIPCEALFEPMKVLGSEPPKRMVGVGFLEKMAKQTDLNFTPKTELQEFQDFMADANKNIIDILVKKGVCETPEERIAELKNDETKANGASNGLDLFGGDLFGATEEKHQGRGLKESDLALNFPNTADIRSVPQYELYQWAKTVCSEVGYFGELFQKHDGEASVDDLQPKMLENIGNAGFLCNGLVCTMKMPEWNAGVTEEELATMPKELAELYDGDVCGLSDILEENPDAKYKLSWRACYGILKRAVNRGKKLPIELGYALVERIIEQAAFVKWTAMNGKDTVKKEGDVSERQIAKIAYDDYIDGESKWDDVKEEDPKGTVSEEDEQESDEGAETDGDEDSNGEE